MAPLQCYSDISNTDLQTPVFRAIVLIGSYFKIIPLGDAAVGYVPLSAVHGSRAEKNGTGCPVRIDSRGIAKYLLPVRRGSY